MLLRAASFALCAVAVSCASSSTSIKPVESDSPLVGMWRGPVPLGAPDGSCPFDVELFADGSAEVNHVDDDSIAEACGFVRVPFTVEGDVLRLGTVAACRHALQRDGDRDLLRIACDEHGTPPASLDNALTLRRLPVEEKRGQDAVAGRWLSTPFAEQQPIELSLDREGRGSFGTELVRFDAHADGTATLAIELETNKKSACLYRATADRLTLRCADPGAGAPTSLIEGGGEHARTVVLVRAP